MIRFKLFIDKDKEVAWLNKEASQGNSFIKFFLGFYFFEKTEEDKYQYDIDLLTTYNDFDNFKSFMKESDIEVLSRWYKWVYVRKLNDNKLFELYSDLDSKIEHYQRIMKMFKVAFIIELICLFIEILVPLIENQMKLINFIFISLIVFFAIVLFGAYSKLSEKIEFYRLEKNLF